MHYGGLGGVGGFRPLNMDDKFELSIKRCLGDTMKVDNNLCEDVWGSITNIGWTHQNGDTASYSFRAAGDLIAAIIERGSYTDWYCSATSGFVHTIVKEALAKEGWSPDPRD